MVYTKNMSENGKMVMTILPLIAGVVLIAFYFWRWLRRYRRARVQAEEKVDQRAVTIKEKLQVIAFDNNHKHNRNKNKNRVEAGMTSSSSSALFLHENIQKNPNLVDLEAQAQPSRSHEACQDDINADSPTSTQKSHEKEDQEQRSTSDDDMNHEDEEENCCSICFGEYETGALLGVANNGHCQHMFHQECITEWLMKHEECPVCRRPYLDRFFEEGRDLKYNINSDEASPPESTVAPSTGTGSATTSPNGSTTGSTTGSTDAE